MKKVCLFLASMLVCMICMTSCGEDDDTGKALTGITVAPKTIKGPVGFEQKITVTAVPADAASTYTFVSQNTAIATVDANGIVKITGVGTTTITVTGGSFSQTVDVEGTINSLAVKDAEGNIAGTYPYNGQPITIALKAEFVPAGADVKPTWASSADNATVEAADDGLTATVTLTGIGTVIITATVNDVEGTYTISTSSAFESAAGYWTFEDPANLGKATIGTDLTELAAVKSVEGPSATKNAVQVDPQTPALKWMHNLTIADTEYEFMWHEWHKYKIANTFTVLFDVRPVEQWDMDRLASPLYYAENIREDEVENGVTYGFQAENAAFWVRSMDEVMKLYANGNQWSFDPFTPEKKAAKPWYRIVIKVWPALQTDPDADPTNHEHAFHRELWIDGKLVNDDLRGDNTYYRVGMFENSPVWFLTGSPGNHTEYDEQKGKYVYDIPMPCSTIAVWDKLLSDDEIASLGGVSK